MFVAHPVTGQTVLYITTPGRCQRITVGDKPARMELIDELYARAVAGARAAHVWSRDDIVIWDNRTVLHRADHSQVVGARTLHRGMVAGVPLAPSDKRAAQHPNHHGDSA